MTHVPVFFPWQQGNKEGNKGDWAVDAQPPQQPPGGGFWHLHPVRGERRDFCEAKNPVVSTVF
jgi:hypothetical protein